jgi:hypothetical protein
MVACVVTNGKSCALLINYRKAKTRKSLEIILREKVFVVILMGNRQHHPIGIVTQKM